MIQKQYMYKEIIHLEDNKKPGYYTCNHAVGKVKNIEKLTKDTKKVTCQRCLNQIEKMNRQNKIHSNKKGYGKSKYALELAQQIKEFTNINNKLNKQNKTLELNDEKIKTLNNKLHKEKKFHKLTQKKNKLLLLYKDLFMKETNKNTELNASLNLANDTANENYKLFDIYFEQSNNQQNTLQTLLKCINVNLLSVEISRLKKIEHEYQTLKNQQNKQYDDEFKRKLIKNLKDRLSIYSHAKLKELNSNTDLQKDINYSIIKSIILDMNLEKHFPEIYY